MPIKSRWTTDIPQVSAPTYLFESPTASLGTNPIIMDAREPKLAQLSQTTYRLWCQRFAAGLLAAGLKEGDRVLLYSGNSVYFPVVIVGTIMAGGIFSGANPSFTARELGYQLQDSGARFLLAASGALDTALAAVKENGGAVIGLKNVFAFDDGLDTAAGRCGDVRVAADGGEAVVRHWTQLLASEAEGRAFQWAELSPDELRTTTATLNYSSGTTGVPKGVEVTHANYVSNAVQVDFQNQLDPQFKEKTARASLLCFLPLYHAYGLTHYTFGAAKRNVPVYMMPKFDFVAMLTYIERYRITTLTLVPPVVVAMAKSPLTRNYDLSSVEFVGCGAAPLGREVCAELERLWPATDGGSRPRVNVKQGWGMTEITCSAMGFDPSEISESSSVGELNANCEAMVVDAAYDAASGKPPVEVARGERGELWVRGPNVMKGYWRREQATRETLLPDPLGRGGVWLMTGDIVHVDQHGKFYVVDRKKELIKTKGNQVAPAELEALLLEHPDVADAAVIGVVVEHDELPRAYVVRAADKKVTAEDVQRFVAERVVKYKQLTGGVEFVEAIPKNPSGKILRKLLRERAQEELKTTKSKL